jgi:hypothetical protein
MKTPPTDRDPDPDSGGFALPIAIWRSGRGLIGRLQMAGVILLLVTIICIPVSIGLGTWVSHQSLRKEWTAAGPACPVVPRVSIAAIGARPPAPFTFQGVHFAFQIGDVSCEAVPKGYFKSGTYPVCQFDAPAAITVTTAARTVIFEPGVGHRATVTVRDGQPSCVVGGWF